MKLRGQPGLHEMLMRSRRLLPVIASRGGLGAPQSQVLLHQVVEPFRSLRHTVAHRNGMSAHRAPRADMHLVWHVAYDLKLMISALPNLQMSVATSPSTFIRTVCPGAFMPKTHSGDQRAQMIDCRSWQH